MTKPVIVANAHSDDYAIQLDFDAAAWFEQASDEDILRLAGIGWGGDYEADEVAAHFRDGATARLFSYLATEPTLGSDRVGFECHVDEPDALTWIRTHRPHLEVPTSDAT